MRLNLPTSALRGNDNCDADDVPRHNVLVLSATSSSSITDVDKRNIEGMRHEPHVCKYLFYIFII